MAMHWPKVLGAFCNVTVGGWIVYKCMSGRLKLGTFWR